MFKMKEVLGIRYYREDRIADTYKFMSELNLT